MRIFFAMGTLGVVCIAMTIMPRPDPVWAAGQGQGQGQGLETRVAALESQVGALATQVSVTALEGQMAALASQLSSLAGRVTALEDLNQPGHTVHVDCGQGQTINSALGDAVGRRELMTIRVSGVCKENVVVTRGRIQIVAASPGSGIQATNPNQPALGFTQGYSKDGYLSLSGLTITGGRTGISVSFGNLLFVNNCTISGNTAGIVVNVGSIVSIFGGIIENNAGDAVSATADSQVIIGGATQIRGNTGHALRLQSSIGDVGGGSLLTGNGAGIGTVGLYTGSRLQLSNATIANNARGIFAVAGSQVWLGNGTVITANGGNGIALNDTSVVGKFRTTTAVTITNNTGWGISCSAAPGTAQLASFPPSGDAIDLSGNTNGAHNCAVSPNPAGS